MGDDVTFCSPAPAVVTSLLSASASWAALPTESSGPSDAPAVAVAGSGSAGARRQQRPSDAAGGPAFRRANLGLGAKPGGAATSSRPSDGTGAVVLKRMHRDTWRKQLKRRDEDEAYQRTRVEVADASDGDDDGDRCVA